MPAPSVARCDARTRTFAAERGERSSVLSPPCGARRPLGVAGPAAPDGPWLSRLSSKSWSPSPFPDLRARPVAHPVRGTGPVPPCPCAVPVPSLSERSYADATM